MVMWTGVVVSVFSGVFAWVDADEEDVDVWFHAVGEEFGVVGFWGQGWGDLRCGHVRCVEKGGIILHFHSEKRANEQWIKKFTKKNFYKKKFFTNLKILIF